MEKKNKVKDSVAATERRFYGKIRPGALRPEMTTPCLEWSGPTWRNGYGKYKLLGKLRETHRVAWLLAFGSWPRSHVSHKCGNRICVNVGHMAEGVPGPGRLGVKGRASGEAHGRVKLSDDDVAAMRSKYNEGNGVTYQALASWYGVSATHAWRIVNRKVRP